MKLLLIRHAKAVSRSKFAETGLPDTRRPLTKSGARKFAEAVEGLRDQVKEIALLASSPLKRAVQTAELVSQAFGGLEITKLKELDPEGYPEDLIKWLGKQKTTGTIALVGHEPSLSELLDVLLNEKSPEPEEFKKGAACLIEFRDGALEQSGTLQWMRPAKDLARQAKHRKASQK